MTHLKEICILTVLIAGGMCDLYLHVPRGSNNRLNERTATRTNANRLFDSQNNNRGGYNVGDAGENKHTTEEEQYRMKYFQSSSSGGTSYLTLQWTNQHGCGGNEDTDPQKQNCNMVLQYMCQPDTENVAASKNSLRNGVQTTLQDYTLPTSKEETTQQSTNRFNNDVKDNRGIHEPWFSYDTCYMRERNKGLFTADQVVKKNKFGYGSAVHTRQNPNGNRYGYECPEERDYYPYWHPSSWKDIAVLVGNTSLCSYYQANSFNVNGYGACLKTLQDGTVKRTARWNNKDTCVENDGEWVIFSNYLEKAKGLTTQSQCVNSKKGGKRHIWAIPFDTDDVTQKECLVALEAPDCAEAPWSRSNHLGDGRGGYSVNYTWTLPHFPSGSTQRCVYRMRYNITTDDYDPFKTNSSFNQNLKAGVVSPITQNPYVDIGGGHTPLKLAINTAQYGRIFQDRSHVFLLKPRPSRLSSENIYNLNVRGKRGNIVQVYPAVEYDFFPTSLQINQGDLVHIQWTGSNTHHNAAPGGDGQAGSQGEGKEGSDRNNVVQINNLNENFPIPFEETNMWSETDIFWNPGNIIGLNSKDLAVSMASSGYYSCVKRSTCGEQSAEAKTKLSKLLDNAPASYEGPLLRFKKGIYHYTCSRNNNFTNRSQKGTILVS